MKPNTLLSAIPTNTRRLDSLVSNPVCEGIAKQTQFLKRQTKKLTAGLTLKAYCLASCLHLVSYRHCAVLIGLLGGFTISKQGLAKRVTQKTVEFLSEGLNFLMGQVAGSSLPLAHPVLNSFKRVLLQDSTTVGLPAWLAAMFPGSCNQSGRTQAQMKIQAVFDLCRQGWVHFAITPFTTNDQAASTQSLGLAKKGDLWIRDLGYFVLSAFKALDEIGAFFLSRLRLDTKIYDQAGKELNLLDLVRNTQRLDCSVLLGATLRLPLRLVAIRLPQEVAAQRRRLARQNRDRRLVPSKERMELLGWTIFVTNVADSQILSSKTIGELYAIRWRIETIFKAWKRHFKITELPIDCSLEHLQCLMIGRLIYCLVFEVAFGKLQWEEAQARTPQAKQPLSYLKFAHFFKDFSLGLLFLFALKFLTPELLRRQIDYHCRYEKRTDRLNFVQKLLALG